jgi:CDP-glucose 4,6-dehydratase
VEEMSNHWSAVSFEDISEIASGPYESGLLKLNCDKALSLLDWKAVLSFEETVRMTANWYRAYYSKPNSIRDITFAQIQEYERLVN